MQPSHQPHKTPIELGRIILVVPFPMLVYTILTCASIFPQIIIDFLPIVKA